MGEASDVKKFRARKLEAGEEIIATSNGYTGNMMGTGADRQHNGAMILTNKRVCFYSKGLMSEHFEQIALDRIASVEDRALLGFHSIRVHTSGNTIEVKGMAGAEVKAMIAKLAELRDKPAATAAPQPTDSPIDAIRKLAELRQAGLVTEEEFASKKAELLARV